MYQLQLLYDSNNTDADSVLTDVNRFYTDIVKGLYMATCKCVPRMQYGFFKFWWDEELTLLKETAGQSFLIWFALGKPRIGREYDI